MSTASATTSHQNHPQQSSGSNSTTNVSHNKTPKVFLQTLGVLFVTTYAVLEISIAQCHHQDAHVIIFQTMEKCFQAVEECFQAVEKSFQTVVVSIKQLNKLIFV